MTDLNTCLQESGLSNLSSLTTGFDKELEAFIHSNQPLFKHACTNKPDSSPRQLLLGLLTKVHIDVSYQLDSNKAASVAMQDVLEDTVGEAHSAKFEYSQSKQLQFIAHLWLFIQGRLGMDYSLANDHADATAALLSGLVRSSQDEVRVEFMASFYDGLALYQLEHKPSGLLGKIKRLFNLH